MNTDWIVPTNPNFTSYYIGIFGATGSGKSMLTRHMIIPLLRETRYNVIIIRLERIRLRPILGVDKIQRHIAG